MTLSLIQNGITTQKDGTAITVPPHPKKNVQIHVSTFSQSIPIELTREEALWLSGLLERNLNNG